MKSHDAAQLAIHLTRLAETYDRKPLTAEALKVWFDTLKEFNAELVLGLLGTWAKRNTKFPAPADVWKVVNDIAMADRERASADLRKEAQQPVKFAKTEEGQRALKHIRRLMKKPKPTPLEHWQRVLQTAQVGTLAHDFAGQALRILERR